MREADRAAEVRRKAELDAAAAKAAEKVRKFGVEVRWIRVKT